MRIYKYELGNLGENKVEMPQGAQVLSAKIDPKGDVCIWAIVNPELENELRTFFVAGTGWELSDAFSGKPIDFYGTVIQEPYVWHIFEVR